MKPGDLVTVSAPGLPRIGIIIGRPKKCHMSGYLYPVFVEGIINWLYPEQIESLQKEY